MAEVALSGRGSSARAAGWVLSVARAYTARPPVVYYSDIRAARNLEAMEKAVV